MGTAEAVPQEHGAIMGAQNEIDAAGATATKAGQQTTCKRSVEDIVKLDAIEDNEVRQILKIPPRRKPPKRG